MTSSVDNHWLPLESNPDVLNPYLGKLGWPVEKYKFYDVLSTEDWAIDMIPKPIKAFMLLYPLSDAQEKVRAEENQRLTANGCTSMDGVYFTEQLIANACGTIACIHAAINLSTLTGGEVTLDDDAWFKEFFGKTQSITVKDRGVLLSRDNSIERAHSIAVSVGQSDVVEDTSLHFITILEKNGRLLELDGRKVGPIDHGPSSADTFAQDAAELIKKFIDRDPTSLQFSIMALAPADTENE